MGFSRENEAPQEKPLFPSGWLLHLRNREKMLVPLLLHEIFSEHETFAS